MSDAAMSEHSPVFDQTAATATAFRNARVEPGELPALVDEPFVQVESSWLRLQQFGWILLAIVTCVVVSIIAAATPMPRWVALIVGLGSIALAIAGIVLEALAFEHRGWLLREKDLSARQGLISRNTTTAPFSRVQHVAVNRSGIDRFLGIARLITFTAGAGSADLVISGLRAETADRLKETILVRSGHLDASDG